MDKWIPAIIGFFAGRRLAMSDPKSLLIGTCILEVVTLILAFVGNPLGGLTAVLTGFVLVPLGIRNGCGVIRCLLCGFFQFFFILGILVAPSSAGAYLFLHIACMAYPIIKALL